ncbi:uncharacterized protein LOC106778205 isoform X1 [Vigna radiata var. radiata]|uniref:Uncharacterized protein LOC106778205 isoform X1 n=1 Tax=Vigna radiata var. radiata TaxID=3916 RepID=A0A1S3VU83_VIGRR|nr:uncharacterized protein LOC106778205 isoform X1 [Vigna radiata var. radiata]XP_022631816.1 uncharacterized protein LOC106778205 isoform X1 [Vigna radiata var. radiata]
MASVQLLVNHLLWMIFYQSREGRYGGILLILSVDFVLRLSPLVVLYFSKSLLAVYWSTQMGLSLNIGWFNLSMLVKFCVLNKVVLTTDHSCAADVSARAFYEAILVLDFVLKNFRLDLRRPLPDQDRIKVWINEKYKASAILQFE